MKKIASLLLAIVMLVSLASGMGISAFAADVFVTDDGIRYVENYVENGENTVKIVGYSGKGAEIVIPNTISGKKVTRISGLCDNPFWDYSMVKSISIPASVTVIDNMAVFNGPNVTVIKVASDNKYYDSRNNCNAIIEKATGTLIAGCKSTKVPNGATKIGRFAFYNCSGLTDITLPESVKSIQHQAFQDCKNLKNITFLNKNCKICELCNPGDKTCDFTIVKGAAIHGYKGSTAEKYAKEYGRKFVALTQLSTPTLKAIVNANGTFKLSWNKVSGAEKYELYIKQADGSYKLMKTTTGTSFTTATAAYGKQYSYKMRAVKGNAKSAYSAVVNAKNTKKLQATTAKVTVNANGSFKISWNKVTGATKYGIYMKQANGSYKWIKTVTGTSWTTAVAAYGKQYTYKVLVANNNKSAQTFSNVVNAKNTKKLQTPSLKVAINKNGSFKLSWGKVAGAEKYELYIKQANGSYKLMKTTTATSFTTAVAAKGKTYSYKIRAVTSKNKNATSNYSNVVNAKNTATSNTVYITPTGKKYHYSQACAGKNAMKTTMTKVKNTYSPCKKCC